MSDADVLAALKALVNETERCDNIHDYGVSQDSDVMMQARAAIAASERGSNTESPDIGADVPGGGAI